MKHLKYFESIIEEPQIGDYVLCKEEKYVHPHADMYDCWYPTSDDTRIHDAINKSVREFINTNFGQIVSMVIINDKQELGFRVKYENIPEYIKTQFTHGHRAMKKTEIIEFAPTKEDLEAKISSKKYNL